MTPPFNSVRSRKWECCRHMIPLHISFWSLSLQNAWWPFKKKFSPRKLEYTQNQLMCITYILQSENNTFIFKHAWTQSLEILKIPG